MVPCNSRMAKPAGVCSSEGRGEVYGEEREGEGGWSGIWGIVVFGD